MQDDIDYVFDGGHRADVAAEEAADLELWALANAINERSEGYKAGLAGREAIAATHIGREFAFMMMVAKIQDMQGQGLHSVRADHHERGVTW